ncbi:asparagine synthase (glutamine-hydrolyzing) [Chloroflexota bacterium]
MCGICGIYGVKDAILIRRMLSVLKHRGPDDEGIFTDANISMGHARLSIIDLSEKGRQPMSNEDNNIWLSVNGEIYNFNELRLEMERKGHCFYSNSDSEVIIHTYEEYGLDFLDKLRGMFAIALYDIRKKRLILARDPIGEKPLYYYSEGDKLFFASEIKAILAAGVKKDIESDALYAYLAYQYTIGEQTIFKGIKKVLPGTMMIKEPVELKKQQYWEIKENIIQGSDEYFTSELRKQMEESTKLRMIADVPIGAFLSGGIDSSVVVALAKPFVKDEFHTFTVGFETFSEFEYARIVSEHLSTTHHEIIVTADMVMNDLPQIAWHYDEPLGDAAIINNYYLSMEAKQYVKVVISGEGGDELFGGYPTYKRGLKYYNVLGIPSIFKYAGQFCFDLIPGTGDTSTFGSKAHKFASYFTQPTYEKAHLFLNREMSTTEINYIARGKSPNVDDMAIYPPDIGQPINRLLAIDLKNLLPEKFLMKADKGTMANSVEERLPLLDKEIINFAFSLPLKLKIRDGNNKYILRKAVNDLLPEKIVNRPKVGFGTPVGHWLGNEMRNMVRAKLEKGELISDFFERDKIMALVQNFDRAVTYRPGVIWTLFALEMWYDVHFKGKYG